MKALLYNMRGFGRPGGRTQLSDYIRQNEVDILGLQETIKQDFSVPELRGLEFRGPFCWNWVPAVGHSGGMLLGFRESAFEVMVWRKGVFFLCAEVVQRNTNTRWRFVLVYGPADHSRSGEFLGELIQEINGSALPTVVGGDFNLIRRAEDKSSGNINWPRVRRFNEAIADMALRELDRAGARFTWSNNQLDPICSVLDRVFVSPAWEACFPLCSLSAITRIGSDHNPLLLDSGEQGLPRTTRFFFQTWWFKVSGFESLVKGKILGLLSEGGPHRGSIEQWQFVSRGIRQFLRGWGANLGREKREFRLDLLRQVEELDAAADEDGLDDEGWALRYHLEDQLVQLDCMEEEYWRQRSRIRWTIEGDSCTAFFHAVANGRRRKCLIPRLVSENGDISDQQGLMEHVYGFYQGLMGAQGEDRVFSLRQDLWAPAKRISEEENMELERSFTLEELDLVLEDMTPDSAPGPNGIPVMFFKRFWGILRVPILAILNDFALGRVDIARLNFGIITLIPKVKGADNIK